MVTRKQSPQQPNHVVSVRLTADIIKRLDALAERTNRSRGVYLRSAITRMLPTLEAEHWSQTSAVYESDYFHQEFIQLTTPLLGHMSSEDPTREE
ncbi:ribbon-helix-helix protein, CopG family [Arthrobacter ruber]|uniref:ribbon-helix-helix protein, CopG family n=1 Tax=Arthrobacter ruber TaxID=1258893 RepID=UPI000CF4A1A6|nr:ribbon-helix-helix protein, CopG family [Arthrobacter ruber]